MAADPSSLIGGATPFGWAQLGIGLLGGAARPAGPSSADAIFGPVQFAPDHSNWMINTGSGSQYMTNGPKTGPTQIPTAVMDKGYPVASAGGYPSTGYTTAPAGYSGGSVAQPVQSVGGIPVLWIVAGLVVFMVAKK